MVVAHKHRISVGLGNTYKNGSRCVRIRVTYAGDRIDLYTTLSATEKQWDSKKQRFKQGCTIDGVQFNILNATIDTYIGFVDDYWKSPVRVTPEAQVPLTLESKFRMTPIKS